MKGISYDWYEIIEEQSDVFKANLAIHDMNYDVIVDDPNGFLIIDVKHLPDELLSFLSEDMAFPTIPFPDRDKVLLQNDKLTRYLTLARGFKMFEMEENDYIEVLFERVDDDLSLTASDISDPLDLKSLLGGSACIFGCWELFVRQENEELAYELASEADIHLTLEMRELFSGQEATDEVLKNIFSMFMGFAIVSVVFAWLKDFKRAAGIVELTAHAKIHHAPMAIILRHYLELMIIHEQEELLAEFFEDELIREGYLTHYEIYMLKFVDPNFEVTRTQQVKTVQNRIADYRDLYL